jgi:pyridoxamine 5'-phosphate oxidase
MDITNLREQYKKGSLSKTDTLSNPITQLEKWVKEAIEAKVPEPNAMCIATISDQGRPSARIVLLKEIDEKGIIFYTNYESRKAQEIATNPNVAVVFNWLELERQIRIEGKATRITEEKSTAYFQSRPHGSQLGAHVSDQSKIIEDRSVLEKKLKQLTEKYKEHQTIEKPKHWGGYHIQIEYIEFWQGRPNRLHDRILYSKSENSWTMDRLSP